MANKTIHLWVEYHRKKEEKFVYYPAVKDDDGNIIDEEESKVLDTKWKASWGWKEFLYNDILMEESLTRIGEGEKEPRGLPEDASLTVKKEHTLLFNDKTHLSWEVDLSEARPLIGDRPLLGEGFGVGFGPPPPMFVDSPIDMDKDMSVEAKAPNPRYNGFSWCNAKELEDCIKENYYNENTKKYSPEAIDWIILLGAMKALDSMDNMESRAVFWFEG